MFQFQAQIWDFVGDDSPLEIEEPDTIIMCPPKATDPNECFEMLTYEPDIPGGGIFRQGVKKTASGLRKPFGAFIKRNSGRLIRGIKGLFGYADNVLYKTVDDVINAATNAKVLSNGKTIQKELTGDINKIFQDLADEAGATINNAANGTKYFKIGNTRVGIHASATPGFQGTPTLDINKAGQIFKIRITP